jgi:hypothetical protein
MKTILPNEAVLQHIYSDSRESMIEIFSEFLTAYPDIKQTLFTAYQSGNLRSLKRVLHYHAPFFMYLGLPEVAGIFNNLEIKCSQAESHFSLSKDFAELMQTVEGSWFHAKKELENLQSACLII